MTAADRLCWLCVDEPAHRPRPGRPLLVAVHPEARAGDCLGCGWPLLPTPEQAAAHQVEAAAP